MVSRSMSSVTSSAKPSRAMANGSAQHSAPQQRLPHSGKHGWVTKAIPKHRIGPLISSIFVFAITVAVVVTVFDRRPPFEEVQPATVSPEEAKPGSRIIVTRYVKRIRPDCEATISANIIDSLGYRHPLEAQYFGFQMGPPLGKTESIVRDYPISYTAKDWLGQAKLQAQATYECFPLFSLWPIVTELPQLNFMIVP